MPVTNTNTHKIVQLHAHYRNGHTVCTVLVADDGNYTAYEFTIAGCDISHQVMQSKICNENKIHFNVWQNIFPEMAESVLQHA
jgi:hypothetical protein